MTTTLDTSEMIRQLFGAACDELRVEGDEPLLMSDPSFCYITQNPHHQLFCVGYHDRKAVGRREHIARCKAGQLLFALSSDTIEQDEPAAFLLSGAAGSYVLRVPSRLVIEAMADEAKRMIIGPLFDQWIELLVSMLPQAPVPTRCDVIGPGLTLGPSSAPVRAEKGIVWIMLPATPAHYGGVTLAAHDGPIPRQWPLTPTTWLTGSSARSGALSLRPSSMQPSVDSTAESEWARGAKTAGSVELTLRTRSASFAEDFYAFVVSYLARHRLRLERMRVEQDTTSALAEQVLVSDALGQLALVGRGEVLAEEAEEGSAFEQATHRIARWLDASSLHVPRPAGRTLAAVQTALAQITAVRTRRVLLEGSWWVDDAGALLGFMLDEGDEVNEERLNPVALLPTARGYELWDARTAADQGGPLRVTEEVADRLHPQAYQFYPPLPDRPLRVTDILKFSGRRSVRDVAFVVIVGLALASLTTLIPLLTAVVFDTLIPGAERNLLVQLAAVLAFIYVGQGLFDLARGLALVRVQMRMDATLEAGVWDRLLSLPLPFFRKYSAGELSARAQGIGGIRQILASTTLNGLLGALFSVWSFVLLFVIDPKLAVGATILVVIAIVPAVLATRVGLRRQRAVANIDGKIEGLLLQLLTGITKLRVTAAENRAFATWAKLFARRRDADMGAERINIRIGLFQSVYPILCSMVLYWMLAGTGKQSISTGDFLAFSTAFGMFLGATLQVIDAGLGSLAVIPLYERAKPILEAPTESRGTAERIALAGAIEVNHVSFKYDPDGPEILHDVSFQIRADEFVALVGPSGSGKSTLLRLLLGFEKCTEGGIYYDGQALSGLDVRAVRKQLGVVMQNSHVMGGDIYTNIVGATGLTIDDAWAAARSAALDKDIEAMPMGMHTVIAQGGGTLSGGQRQRLLIARALASAPRVVYFDEATSALDNVTQATVSASLESLRVTRVVIAHRLSTIRHADRIIVLERGRVVQSGKFDELMSQPGPFLKLAQRQMV